MSGSEDGEDSRILIRVGDTEIDITGSQKEVDAKLLQLREDETWSGALSRIRSARENAIAAAIEAARKTGLPERGSAFRALIENSNITKKPDQVLAAIQYLREVEGVPDSPPRVIKGIFEDADMMPPDNLSLYLNRLRERGFLTFAPHSPEKNRYAVLTPEGRSHLDRRSSA